MARALAGPARVVALAALAALAACADRVATVPLGPAPISAERPAVGPAAQPTGSGYRLTITGVGTAAQAATIEGGTTVGAPAAADAGRGQAGGGVTAALLPDAGATRALTPRPSALQFQFVATGSYTYGARGSAGAFRYVYSVYRVRNQSGAALTNLSLLAASTASALAGSAVSDVRLAGDVTPAPATAAALALSMTPAGGSVLARSGAPIGGRADVLQIFPEAEIAAVAPLLTGYTPLAYGFSVLDTLTGGRTLAATAAGQYPGLIFFGFKLPLQATASQDVFTFTYNFYPVTDATARVTQSLEEGDAAARAAASARATALGAPLHVFRGRAHDAGAAARTFCGVRTAGTRSAPTALLGTTCASEVAAFVVTPSSALGAIPLLVGATQQLTATLTPAGGFTPPTAIAYASADPSVATVSPTGLVTAVAPGTTRIHVGPYASQHLAEVEVDVGAVAQTPATWTFCTEAGAVCGFTGLRTVRLGGPNGPYVQTTAFGSVPCGPYGFGERDPAPGQPLHCDYGPILTTTMSNPMPGMAGLAATVTVPLGAAGAAGPQIRSTTDVGVEVDGSGAFRTTCDLAKYDFIDPIVYPGQVNASHLHMFFGNAAVTASSTPETIAASGNSTCRGGTLNRTAYWIPALFDARTNTAIAPVEAIFYYKTGYNIDPRVVVPPPDGLRMIAGDKSATTIQDFIEWGCRDAYLPNAGTVPTACPVGDAVRLTIIFPQCWDGKNLDSPDHKRHMAYPLYSNDAHGSVCPASHPVTIPEVTEIFHFTVTDATAPAFWRLSSDMYSTSLRGGFSAHADWMNGWDPATMRTIVTQCLNKALDCGVATIGGGKELY